MAFGEKGHLLEEEVDGDVERFGPGAPSASIGWAVFGCRFAHRTLGSLRDFTASASASASAFAHGRSDAPPTSGEALESAYSLSRFVLRRTESSTEHRPLLNPNVPGAGGDERLAGWPRRVDAMGLPSAGTYRRGIDKVPPRYGDPDVHGIVRLGHAGGSTAPSGCKKSPPLEAGKPGRLFARREREWLRLSGTRPALDEVMR